MNAGDIVVLTLLQHPLFYHRARRNNANYITGNEALCKRRILQLLADCHFISLINQLVDIDVHRMIRHAAHRSALG